MKNIVSGTIYLLDNGNVAVESEVIKENPDAYWTLYIPYQELVSTFSDYGESSGAYDILTVSFDDWASRIQRAARLERLELLLGNRLLRGCGNFGSLNCPELELYDASFFKEYGI